MKRVLMVVGVMVALAWAVPASAQDAAQVKHGQQVFTAQHCSMCHSVDGKGNKTGPLDGIGSKLTTAEIEKWLKDAKTMKATLPHARKLPMKSYATLPKADFDALVAYLESLKKQ
jgi:mono/diheme cytochrome c family protein